METAVLNELFLGVLKLLTLVIAFLFIRYGAPWLKAIGVYQNLEVIARLAQEAYVWVERLAPEWKIKGEDKMAKAKEYLLARLTEKGITVTEDQMRAVIESVWMEYNPDKY